MGTQGTGTDRDESWFTDTYVRHAPAIRAYAARRVPQELDDVVAEVFTTAWRLRGSVPGDPGEARLWLYAVARHTVLHAHRSALRRARLAARAGLTAVEDGAEVWSDQVADRLDAQALVRQALGRLSETDAEILRLWAWEGLEPKEIAVVLECSPVAARVRWHRARRRLAAVLGLTPVAALIPYVHTPVEEATR